MSGEHVPFEGRARVLPRVADVRGTGKVLDGGRPQPRERIGTGAGVEQLDRGPIHPRFRRVDGSNSRAVPAGDRRSGFQQVCDQVSADETGRSRDEDGPIRCSGCAHDVAGL